MGKITRTHILMLVLFLEILMWYSKAPALLGQTSRSKSQGKTYWYPKKTLITRNTHVKHQSSSPNCSEDLSKDSFQKMGQTPRSRSQNKKSLKKKSCMYNMYIWYETLYKNYKKVLEYVKAYFWPKYMYFKNDVS